MQRVHQFNAFRTLICLTGLLTLLTTRVGFAQQIASEDWAFGYEAFNLLLQESDIEICNRGEWSFTPVDEKIAIFINSNSNRYLSKSRSVPALVMSSRGVNSIAKFRPSLGLVDQNKPQNFYSSRDCPIVRPESTHEVFLGVDSLICNTPGYLKLSSEQTISNKQFYPPTDTPRRGLSRQVFSALTETPTKRVWVADPLLFSNQMLFKGNSLRLSLIHI